MVQLLTSAVQRLSSSAVESASASAAMRARPSFATSGPTSLMIAAAMTFERMAASAMVISPPIEVPRKTARAIPACSIRASTSWA